jgi:hypothetical protein
MCDDLSQVDQARHRRRCVVEPRAVANAPAARHRPYDLVAPITDVPSAERRISHSRDRQRPSDIGAQESDRSARLRFAVVSGQVLVDEMFEVDKPRR